MKISFEGYRDEFDHLRDFISGAMAAQRTSGFSNAFVTKFSWTFDSLTTATGTIEFKTVKRVTNEPKNTDDET